MSTYPSSFVDVYTSYVKNLFTWWDMADDHFDRWLEPDFWMAEVKAGSFSFNYMDLDLRQGIDRVAHLMPIPTPVYMVDSRIKKLDQAARKISAGQEDRYPDGFSRKSLDVMHDMLGIRLVTYIPGHLRWVDSVLRESSQLELHPDSKPKCYLDDDILRRIGLQASKFQVNKRKPTGYSSLHYIVRLKARPGVKLGPWFELQVRTLASHFWGEIEHHLGYKPDNATQFSVRRQFRVISDHMTAIDAHLDFIGEELSYLQASPDQATGRVLPDSELNAENLPRVYQHKSIPIYQEQLSELPNILATYGVTNVGQFDQLFEFNTLDSILTSWADIGGDGYPGAIIITHTLGTLNGKKATSKETDSVIRAFIELRKLTRRTNLPDEEE